MSMRTLLSRLHSILVTGAIVLGASIVTSGASATTALASPAAPDFGSNVVIFNPSMSQAAIQAKPVRHPAVRAAVRARHVWIEQ